MKPHQIIGQLGELRRRLHFTATRVGEPGCAVRRDAEDDREALDVALELVKRCSPAAVQAAAIVVKARRERGD